MNTSFKVIALLLVFVRGVYLLGADDPLCPSSDGYVRIRIYWNDWGSLGQGTLSKADVIRLSKWMYRRHTVCRVRERITESLLIPLENLRQSRLEPKTSDCRVVIIVEGRSRNDTIALATSSEVEFNGVYSRLSKEVFKQIATLMPHDQAVRMLRDTVVIDSRER